MQLPDQWAHWGWVRWRPLTRLPAPLSHTALFTEVWSKVTQLPHFTDGLWHNQLNTQGGREVEEEVAEPVDATTPSMWYPRKYLCHVQQETKYWQIMERVKYHEIISFLIENAPQNLGKELKETIFEFIEWMPSFANWRWDCISLFTVSSIWHFTKVHLHRRSCTI